MATSGSQRLGDRRLRGRYRLPLLVGGSAGLHGVALTALVLAPDLWPAIVAGVFADHVLLAAAGLTPRSTLLGPNLTRLPADAAARGEVALTFDDGPDPEVTPQVLDLLAQRGAKAAFFAVGRRVQAHPDLAAEILRQGHRVENHSHTHPAAFSMYPPGALRREVERAQHAIAGATGREPSLFRAPAGFRSFLLDPILHRAGLALASWTRRGFDTVSRDPVKVSRRLLAGLAPGDVLLLHDGSCARTSKGTPVILEVLPRLLDALEARRWKAVPFASPPLPQSAPDSPQAKGRVQAVGRGRSK
jgi:peptidoglycan/xylan/chitin deacetylase (PgdA/CDA1 family)